MRVGLTALLGFTVALLAGQGCSAETADLSQQAAPAPAHGAHAVVLAYHHVADDTPASTSITPALFDAQLDYIDTQGFEVWPLLRIASALRAGETIPENVVGLSFDDASASIYTNVHPRLHSRGWSYTVFVNTGAIDAGSAPYMNWQQIKELADQGVTLGNHSHSHAHLVTTEDKESGQHWQRRVYEDINRAQQRIEEQTGVTPTLFAYPYGEYSASLSEVVDELGLIGFGQHSGAIGPHSDFTALPRFPVGGSYTDLARLTTALHSRPLNVTATPRGPMILKAGDKAASRPPLDISIPQGNYRLHQLACYATGQGQMQLLEQPTPGTYRIRPKQPLSVGRTKYNCTAPHKTEPGVFFWWSYLLMTPHSDGSWYRS